MDTRCIKCDFCGCNLLVCAAHTVHGPGITVAIEVDDTIQGGWKSDDDWAPCDECFSMLVNHNYQGLVDLVCESNFVYQHDELYPALAGMLTQVYQSLEVIN